MQIAVIGKEDCTEEEYGAAEAAGHYIAASHAVLFCGGRGGVMEAACRGAKEAGGTTVGILPDTGKGNPVQKGPIPPWTFPAPCGTRGPLP